MNKRQRKVFTLLRTKTKAIGLNRKELESLALRIDKNLELEEDASDEEVDAAVEEAIDAALPFLEVSQSMAQRSIQKSIQRFRDKHGITDDDDDDDEPNDDGSDDDAKPDKRQREKGGKNRQASEVDSEIMKLIKEQNEVIKSLKGQIDSMQGETVAEKRRAKLKGLVKDTGTFGKSVMKQFDLMTFKDDDAFDDYLDEVQKDLDELNQERANEGLSKLGTVPSGEERMNPESKKQEVLSDDAVIALAGGTPQKSND